MDREKQIIEVENRLGLVLVIAVFFPTFLITLGVSSGNGLVFEETPTYTEILNGTPKLTWIFKLSSEFATKESQLVAPRGIEPRFTP